MDDIPSRTPGWISKTRLSRRWFIIWNVLSLIIFCGSLWLFVFKDPAYVMWALVVAVVLTFIDSLLRFFRMNDISADTQKNFWKSGNMFFVNGWLPFFAPSSSSPNSSLNEVTSFLGDRNTRLKLIGRNFLRWFVVWIVLVVIIFGYWQYVSWSTEQRALNQSPTVANIVLSLGDNESTTLSMAVPGGYVGSGVGAIYPISSLDRGTPNIGFYSEPATLANVNSLKKQTILNTETQIHYADSDTLTVNTATGTFLGYPALVMTSKSDRPAKTIVFRIGSSTNMIEIRINYSPSDPASERQVVDDILNSVKSSVNADVTSGTFSTASPSLTITSPLSGETLRPGSTYDIAWQSSGFGFVVMELAGPPNAGFPGGLPIWIFTVPASEGHFSWTISMEASQSGALVSELPAGEYKLEFIGSDNNTDNNFASDTILDTIPVNITNH